MNRLIATFFVPSSSFQPPGRSLVRFLPGVRETGGVSSLFADRWTSVKRGAVLVVVVVVGVVGEIKKSPRSRRFVSLFRIAGEGAEPAIRREEESDE